MRSDLLTTAERERERDAVELVLAGVTDALTVVPVESEWRRCFLDMKMMLKTALPREGS
jgi:hypothetical protein